MRFSREEEVVEVSNGPSFLVDVFVEPDGDSFQAYAFWGSIRRSGPTKQQAVDRTLVEVKNYLESFEASSEPIPLRAPPLDYKKYGLLKTLFRRKLTTFALRTSGFTQEYIEGAEQENLIILEGSEKAEVAASEEEDSGGMVSLTHRGKSILKIMEDVINLLKITTNFKEVNDD